MLSSYSLTRRFIGKRYSRIIHSMETSARVVIVGAGVAGIAAACRLMEGGLSDILLLEAESRIGGRVCTVPFGDGIIDLGGQWVHGEKGNIVFSMASPLNLLSETVTEITDSEFFESSGKKVDPDMSSKLLGMFLELTKAVDGGATKNFHSSVGEYFKTQFQRKVEEEQIPSVYLPLTKSFLNWFEKFENSIDGSDTWFETSCQGLAEYKVCEGNLLWRWKSGGYKNIIDILTKRYPNPEKELPVHNKTLLKKEVVRINWDNQQKDGSKRVVTECADGSVFISDHVIVTTSLGVLKERVHSMFHPPLPRNKLIAVKGLAIGTVDKIFLKFPYKWWTDTLLGFSLLWSQDDAYKFCPARTGGSQESGGRHWLQDVFGFYAVDDQPTVLCGWVVGTSARQMEVLSDREVLEGCMELLRLFVGQHYDIPDAESIRRSQWGTNPHFRGSYSFRGMDTEVLGTSAAMLAEPVCNMQGKQVLLFAGEATHDHYYSTVHGAIETGHREAERLLNMHGLQPKHISVKSEVHTYDVVIVGAGIAGLAAANTLLEGGLTNIVVLEAQDQAGGRIDSQLLNGGWVERGAQWIHGQNNPIWALAEQNGLLATFTSAEGEGPYVRDDGVVFEPALVQEVDDIIRDILEDCEQFADIHSTFKIIPSSIGYQLRKKFDEYLESCKNDTPEIRKMKEELYDWHLRFQIIDNSCSELENLSARAWGNYKFCGGQDYWNFKNGYSSLVKTVAEKLPPSIVHYSKPVVHIKWQKTLSKHSLNQTRLGEQVQAENIRNVEDACLSVSDNLSNLAIERGEVAGESGLEDARHVPQTCPVEIECADGTRFQARHTIITCSLGVLKENHKKMFHPELPQMYTQVIEDMGFATINKIFLDYETPWWDPKEKGYQLIWSRETAAPSDLPSSWTHALTGFDVLPSPATTLLGWVGGLGAQFVENLTEQQIAEDCTQLFRRFSRNPNIPLPRQVIRTRWHSNPYIRGGYSNTTSQCDKSGCGPQTLAVPICADVSDLPSAIKHPVLLFAGEATHKHHFSTTHGAYETGQAQAQFILSYISNM